MMDEHPAHLDAFFITVVCFLGIKVNKTDLGKTMRKRWNISMDGLNGKVSQKAEVLAISVSLFLPKDSIPLTDSPFGMTASVFCVWITAVWQCLIGKTFLKETSLGFAGSRCKSVMFFFPSMPLFFSFSVSVSTPSLHSCHTLCLFLFSSHLTHLCFWLQV